MASVGLLALIDDIATLLDDVAILSKVAVKKTAGVLGDDLALNAEQVSGVRAERELPVVWAVFKGSAKNKVILVPIALLLSAFLPWLMTPLLMLGGAFLCFEGFEKLAHKLLHHTDDDKAMRQAVLDPTVNLVEFEKHKIKGAIRTDFILSAEIVVIVLGTVQSVPFIKQVAVLVVIAAAITVGVYGIVAGIVKLDDAGLYLLRTSDDAPMARFKQCMGAWLLRACPYLMKTLSIVGTAAMFLVGGGILLHGFPFGHELMHYSSELLRHPPELLLSTFVNAATGIVVGALLLAMFSVLGKLFGKRTAA